MIRKESGEGVGYSVVESGGARHFFAAARPRRGAALQEQAQDALGVIDQLMKKENSPVAIAAQSVFLRNPADRAACENIMRDFYGTKMPATTYVPQAPCDGKLMALEAWGVRCGPGEVEIIRQFPRTVIVRHGGIDWAHLGGIHCTYDSRSVYDCTLTAFHQAAEQLAAAGFRFEDVIRTWLYLGDITGAEGQMQRYREMNRARADFYRELKFFPGLTPPNWNKPLYPASTGMGAAGLDVTIGCTALKTDRPDTLLVPLENPKQISAYDYAHRYGSESPKFCRALAVATGDCATVFISGTASITSSETRHTDDLRAQTRQTLDNIEALIAAENFREHGLAGFGATLADMALARVYLKRPEDYALAKSICASRLGELPVIYATGDICRPELLVEIEGIAFCKRQG